MGTVISGTVMSGCIKINDTLLMGPDTLGVFQPVQIKGIHRKRLPVKEVRAGQAASFALKKIKRSAIRKGMVLIAKEANPKGHREFEAELLILHHPTTIGTKYQAMVHCGSIRQTASIVNMDKDLLRTGDKSKVRFRFIKHPEFVRIGARLVFREGRTKAVGTVTNVFEMEQQPTASSSSSSSASTSGSASTGTHTIVLPPSATSTLPSTSSSTTSSSTTSTSTTSTSTATSSPQTVHTSTSTTANTATTPNSPPISANSHPLPAVTPTSPSPSGNNKKSGNWKSKNQ